jgi:hypothetical protein
VPLLKAGAPRRSLDATLADDADAPPPLVAVDPAPERQLRALVAPLIA